MDKNVWLECSECEGTGYEMPQGCETCDWTGYIDDEDCTYCGYEPCPDCEGEGVVERGVCERHH